MREGMPQGPAFEALCGRPIAELRLRYPGVRACGEMVDVLWQRERREAALMLEEYWNELARARPFALFCASRIDPLRGEAYGAGLDRLCRAHTHLVPARDYGELNRAVDEAARCRPRPPSARRASRQRARAAAASPPCAASCAPGG